MHTSTSVSLSTVRCVYPVWSEHVLSMVCNMYMHVHLLACTFASMSRGMCRDTKLQYIALPHPVIHFPVIHYLYCYIKHYYDNIAYTVDFFAPHYCVRTTVQLSVHVLKCSYPYIYPYAVHLNLPSCSSRGKAHRAKSGVGGGITVNYSDPSERCLSIHTACPSKHC